MRGKQDFQGISMMEIGGALEIIRRIGGVQKRKVDIAKKDYPLINALFKQMSQLLELRKNKKQQHLKGLKQKKKQVKGTIKKAKILQIKNIQTNNPDDQQLNSIRQKCYICKVLYLDIHQFYHKLCKQCATFSLGKRNQTANLKGIEAIVTGGRIKIGYQIALKLLKDGARVFITTRFAKDAYLRYSSQDDYKVWKDNLLIYHCDFMSSSQVTSFINDVKKRVSKIDILINNAAQTIARPVQFYNCQLENQQKMQITSESNINMKGQHIHIESYPSLYNYHLELTNKDKNQQIDLKILDQFGQPLDKRNKNTWNSAINEVSLDQCLTTQIINSTIPFYLIGSFKQLMMGDFPAWIINVSSMQGSFSRAYKSSNHPHTNMAKASLNMITRTCALDFAKHKIFMNSIDTGWVTNQNPLITIKKMQNKQHFYPPLDCIQGAMRCLDPIYQGILLKEYPFGKFFKDYKQSQW